MKIILYIIITVFVLCLLTFLLPKQIHVERKSVLTATPSAIMAILGSGESYQKINPFKTDDPDLKIELNGAVNGVGSGFRFEGKLGKGKQTIQTIDENHIVYDVVMEGKGASTQTITLAPKSETETEVIWTMDADMGMNPIARIFGLFMDKMMGPIFETGLKNLSEVTSSN